MKLDKSKLFINLFSYIGNIIYYPVRIYKRSTFNITKAKRILIVAYRHGIGTFILLTPLLKTLKKNIPYCKITILVDSDVVAELASSCQYIDKIILKKGLSDKNLLDGIRYFKEEIGPHRFDLIISTLYERTHRNSFWTYFSRAPYRIGFDERINAFLDTYSFKWDRKIHEVENYLLMLQGIGCEEIYDDLNLEISRENINYTDSFLYLNNISRKDVILGIHPGAKRDWFQKIWPLEFFIEVAERFSCEFKAKVFFFGGSDENEMFAKLDRCNANYVLANKQNISQSQALIKCCSLFLSNDSGLMHIAAAHRIPTVAIFGPTDPMKNSPWKVPHKIIKDSMKCSPCYNYSKITCQRNECMNSILPDQVFQVLKDFYNGK